MTARLAHPVLSLSLALALAACGDDRGDGTTDTTGDVSGEATTEPEDLTAGDATTDPATSEPITTGSPTGDATSTGDASAGTTAAPETTGTAETTAETTPETTVDATTEGAGQELPPTDSAEALEAWLAGGSYKTWAAESMIHASAGPHGGNVRTFVNDVLLGSLAADSAAHPLGAATVKELYGGGVDAPIGYAVMVKLAPDSQAGDGWYWYERLDDTTYADGTGVGLCTGCHGGGADYVLTPYPLQ